MIAQRLLVAALGVALTGCQLLEDPGPPQGSVFPDPGSLNGSFQYSAWDTRGRLAVVGTISLTVHGDTLITGVWDLEWAPGADTTEVVGPQIGTGTLVGWLWNSRAYTNWGADLNPQYADNNVFIGGRFGGNEPSTGWSFSGFPGVISQGRLTLVRLTR